jgi:hypothetical protein
LKDEVYLASIQEILNLSDIYENIVF